MLVPFYCDAEGSGVSSAVVGTLNPARYELVTFSRWPDFSAACRNAAVGIAVDGGELDQVRRLAELRETVSSGLVRIDREGSFVASRSVDIAGVVSVSREDLRRDPRALDSGMRRAATNGYLRRHADRITAAAHLSKPMKRDIRFCLLTEPPPKGTMALASLCKCSNRQLWDRWRLYAFDGGPKRFLQWVFVVHIVVRRPDGLSWEWLAGELETDPRRMQRTMRTLVDMTLDEAIVDAEAVLAQFEDYFTATFRLSPCPSVLETVRDLSA